MKGSLVVEAVVITRRNRREGRVTTERLEARLGAEALELLEEKVDIARWYPILPFVELVELDWELFGNREPDHARRAGAASADRLFDRGIYQQLEYAERATLVRSRSALIRQARLITTITDSLYDFLEVDVRVDAERPDSLEILYGNARPFADVLRYTTEGFMNQINRRQGSARRWTSERAQPDEVAFRLPLPARLAGEGSDAAS